MPFRGACLAEVHEHRKELVYSTHSPAHTVLELALSALNQEEMCEQV